MKYRVATNGSEFRLEAYVIERYGFLFAKSRFSWKPLESNGNVAKDDYLIDTFFSRESAENKLKATLSAEQRKEERKAKLHYWTSVEESDKILRKPLPLGWPE
jgi:hypothetical protein